MPLVIVGERDGQEGELPSWVEEAITEGSVRFTGFVETSNLRWLLRNCALYICLSLDEGFGLPPVEARALGAQVLVSDRPVFRETLGAEAHYVDPTSVADIGRAVARLLQPGTALPADEDLQVRHSWDRTVGLIRQELLSLVESDRARGRT
jgi:glycosyltransferase involved in cell wall biosynthesis